MAMRGMLRSLGTKASADLRANETAAAPIDVKERLALLDAFEEEGIGWFWATDGDGRIVYLSSSALRRFEPNRDIIGQPLGSVVEPVQDEDRNGPARPLSFLPGARNK